jgi:peptide/nickel transport system substrate-binding protein
MKKNQKIHPAIFELKDDLNKGKLTRREFLRFATLLGMSAVSASQMAGLAFPTKAFAAKNIKRGGTLRVASPVTRAKHPSRFDAFGEANMLRQVAEYLTFWDNENITHPYLLENWEVSDDLKTWTLNLRKGINFSNGEMFTTDDIVFTMKEWYKEDVSSSMMGLMNYLDPSGIEKVGRR